MQHRTGLEGHAAVKVEVVHSIESGVRRLKKRKPGQRLNTVQTVRGLKKRKPEQCSNAVQTDVKIVRNLT